MQKGTPCYLLHYVEHCQSAEVALCSAPACPMNLRLKAAHSMKAPRWISEELIGFQQNVQQKAAAQEQRESIWTRQWQNIHALSLPHARRSLSLQWDVEIIAWHADAAPVAYFGGAVQLSIAVRQGAIHGRRHPEAQQMPLLVHLLQALCGISTRR